MRMPVLETRRLRVREFDLSDLDVLPVGPVDLGEREQWLRWIVLSYAQLAEAHQPTYGDRGIVLSRSGELIGACGFAPLLAPFHQVPGWQTEAPQGYLPEVGLYWAIAPAHRNQGYATEAAKALVDYAFQELHLARIVATTTYDNAASMAVMRKLGMRLERNPLREPEWLQVVAVLENRA